MEFFLLNEKPQTAQPIQVSMVDSFRQRDGSMPACSTFCLFWMHLHKVSNEETTKENKTPSRFMYSAKIHSFQYTSIPFCLHLVSAMFFPFPNCDFKGIKWACACWIMSASRGDPSATHDHLEGEGGSVGAGGACWGCSSCLARYHFFLRASSDILVREYWHSHIVPLTTCTAIPKCPSCTMIPSSHRTALAADNRQDLDFCDAEISGSSRYF